MSFDEVYRNFGGEANVFVRNSTWVGLVRPKQVTLGASVLMPTRSMLSLSELNEAELIEFGDATRKLEGRLKDVFAYDKINYLLLMMKDPHLHFHVLPRYAEDREFGGRIWRDGAWPKAPDMQSFVDDAEVVRSIHDALVQG